jgi:hypothetical protein
MKRLLVLLTASLALTACSKHRNLDPFKNGKTAADERDLQARDFVSECALKPVDAILTGIMSAFSTSIKAATTTYRFDGANVTRTTDFYTTTDCSGETAIRFQELGEFNLHKDQKTSDGGKAIDIDYSSLEVTTVNGDGVTVANSSGLCGKSDWAAGDKMDETAQAANANCFGAEMPRHDSNVYRVDDKTLYLGAVSDQSTDPSDRPTALNTSVPYKAK